MNFLGSSVKAGYKRCIQLCTIDSSGCPYSTNASLQSLNIPGLKIGFQMSRVPFFSTSFPHSSHLVPKLDSLGMSSLRESGVIAPCQNFLAHLAHQHHSDQSHAVIISEISIGPTPGPVEEPN